VRNGRGRALRLARDDVAVRTTRVALAAAHLDHDPTNNRLRNLKALCQRCHMLHDHEEHQRRRLLTLRMRNAIGDLFLGLYPHIAFRRTSSIPRAAIAKGGRPRSEPREVPKARRPPLPRLRSFLRRPRLGGGTEAEKGMGGYGSGRSWGTANDPTAGSR